jgi:hypothetical protein
MNKLKALFLLSVILFSGMSCKEETSLQEAYSYDIYNYEGDFNNLNVIENYLAGKNYIITGKVFTGESEKELDEQAIALYDKNNAKINTAELSSKIKGVATFSYGLTKGYNVNLLRETKYIIIGL